MAEANKRVWRGNYTEIEPTQHGTAMQQTTYSGVISSPVSSDLLWFWMVLVVSGKISAGIGIHAGSYLSCLQIILIEMSWVTIGD